MRLPLTPATALWRELRDEVRRSYPAGRVVVAIDGIDGAGKTTFADGLAEVFAEEGSAVYRASIDGFHRWTRSATEPRPPERPGSSSRPSTCSATRRSSRSG